MTNVANIKTKVEASTGRKCIVTIEGDEIHVWVKGPRFAHDGDVAFYCDAAMSMLGYTHTECLVIRVYKAK